MVSVDSASISQLEEGTDGLLPIFSGDDTAGNVSGSSIYSSNIESHLSGVDVSAQSVDGGFGILAEDQGSVAAGSEESVNLDSLIDPTVPSNVNSAFAEGTLSTFAQLQNNFDDIFPGLTEDISGLSLVSSEIEELSQQLGVLAQGLEGEALFFPTLRNTFNQVDIEGRKDMAFFDRLISLGDVVDRIERTAKSFDQAAQQLQAINEPNFSQSGGDV
jgi:hypothetical protein